MATAHPTPSAMHPSRQQLFAVHDHDGRLAMLDAVLRGGADDEADHCAAVVCSHDHKRSSQVGRLVADGLANALPVRSALHNVYLVRCLCPASHQL